MSEAQLKQVVFPVAGLGSRFLPVTKSIPKEMLPIIDKPLIQFAVEEAIQAGAEEIIFVTSHTKTAIEDYFSKNSELEIRLRESNKSESIQTIHPDYLKNIKFSFVRQNEPNGLGHAILQAKNLITIQPRRSWISKATANPLLWILFKHRFWSFAATE